MIPPRLFGLVVWFAIAAASGRSSDTPLLNPHARTSLNLNGHWSVIVDPFDIGYFSHHGEPFDAAENPRGGYFLDRKPESKSDLIEYSFDGAPTLAVPGDWNSQDPQLFYYEGSVWYRRVFDYQAAADRRQFLYFAAVDHRADVYLNGKKLGTHVGGFTPFSYEVTGKLRPTGNSLVVRVNNQRLREGVPTLNKDWWNYGGITRDVLLVETPTKFIRDYHVQLKRGSRDRIEAVARIDGIAETSAPAKVRLALPELGLAASAEIGADGVARFELAAPNLALWSPDNPQIYTVELGTEHDRITDRIGFRTIETRGADILLNGRSVFLRGICLHEENPLRGGRITTEGEARMLLQWAKDLGCNFVRLVHYPHDERMARIADEMGLLLWEEIPVYWMIQWENQETLANAKAQLTDMILRDRNRASVIIWSVANETPVIEARTRFLKELIDTARLLDPTRLVSAAMIVETDPNDSNHKRIEDPLSAYTDLVSFNQYTGWYTGLPDKIPQIRWTIKHEKPVLISEFGAGALQGFYADPLTRFSEEFQEDLYRKTLVMLAKIPQWRGTTPWVLCDFRSPRRPLGKIQDGWNRKGLIGQNGVRKKAFYVLKEFYEQKAAEERQQP